MQTVSPKKQRFFYFSTSLRSHHTPSCTAGPHPCSRIPSWCRSGGRPGKGTYVAVKNSPITCRSYLPGGPSGSLVLDPEIYRMSEFSENVVEPHTILPPGLDVDHVARPWPRAPPLLGPLRHVLAVADAVGIVAIDPNGPVAIWEEGKYFTF